MNVLIVYDSIFGNTERLARVMGEACGGRNQVQVLRCERGHAGSGRGGGRAHRRVPHPRFQAHAGREAPAHEDYSRWIEGGKNRLQVDTVYRGEEENADRHTALIVLT